MNRLLRSFTFWVRLTCIQEYTRQFCQDVDFINNFDTIWSPKWLWLIIKLCRMWICHRSAELWWVVPMRRSSGGQFGERRGWKWERDPRSEKGQKLAYDCIICIHVFGGAAMQWHKANLYLWFDILEVYTGYNAMLHWLMGNIHLQNSLSFHIHNHTMNIAIAE